MSESSSTGGAAAPGRPPSGASRRPRHRRDAEATQQRILAAARTEFCARGFDGARVDRIADLAEANKRLLYEYFGNKEALYAAVLADAYREIREGEQALALDAYDPAAAMERLVRFTFRHFLENPWFISLLTSENLQQARHLKRLPTIRELHSPLVDQIRTLLARGLAAGVFRPNVDPVQLYISIAAVGYFYIGNRYTLSTIFDRDLMSLTMVQDREQHAVDMVLGYLTAVGGR